ncbi:hypothetical protein I7X12_07440 [Halosimplex litoreum]|uniref:Nitrite/Sulfite reductase ferredoxin-like domain-containing protein n=1 Tax=Halosimplex litoreum TaxID=1198301 RepID=A0A7T3G182_9EURY|nr:hypothetical protein [Halosimplex litoreum]QPV64436.1 hypothetical protein I7X12_07440 [Halosimplex litoreum]
MNAVEEWKQEKHPLDVVEDVKAYAAEGLSFEEIEQRAGEGEWERLKWAGMYGHGVHDGYFTMRTTVPGGRLTPEQAEVIGEVAAEYATALEESGGEEQNAVWGDAFLDVTTRQDVQMHWIELEDVPEIWARYDEVDLTTIQGCGDSARNVLGCPVAGLDGHECFDAQPQIADIGFGGETVDVDDPEGTTNEDEDNIVEAMHFGLGGSLGSDNEFLDWVETAVPADAVIPAIEALFAAYVDERDDGERFYEWTRRVGNDRLRTVMQRTDANVSGGVARGN